MRRSSSRGRSACWITTISRSRCPPTSRPSPFAAAACRTRSPFAMARTARAASWPKKPPRPLKKLRGPLSQRPTSALSVSPFAAHRPVDSLARWSPQCAAAIVAEEAERIVGRCVRHVVRRQDQSPSGDATSGAPRGAEAICGATLRCVGQRSARQHPWPNRKDGTPVVMRLELAKHPRQAGTPLRFTTPVHHRTC